MYDIPSFFKCFLKLSMISIQNLNSKNTHLPGQNYAIFSNVTVLRLVFLVCKEASPTFVRYLVLAIRSFSDESSVIKTIPLLLWRSKLSYLDFTSSVPSLAPRLLSATSWLTSKWSAWHTPNTIFSSWGQTNRDSASRNLGHGVGKMNYVQNAYVHLCARR